MIKPENEKVEDMIKIYDNGSAWNDKDQKMIYYMLLRYLNCFHSKKEIR